MLDWVENNCLMVLSSIFSPVFKLNQENTHLENMSDILFEKQSSWWENT